MKGTFGYRGLRWAALAGVGSLALMIWGVVDPRPISLVIAMSIPTSNPTRSDFTNSTETRPVSLRSARAAGAWNMSGPGLLCCILGSCEHERWRGPW